MILQLNAVLLIILLVVTSGLAMAQIFEHLHRPHLFTLYGSPARLIALRVVVLASAALASIAVWGLLFLVFPAFTALPIFFAFEAIMLDICTLRIRFEHLPEAVPVLNSANSVSRRRATGAF